MKGVLVGKSCNSFTDKDTGELIEYGKIYLVTNFPKNLSDSEKFDGFKCIEVKCRPADCSALIVGDRLVIDVDKNNRAVSIDVIPDDSSIFSGDFPIFYIKEDI